MKEFNKTIKINEIKFEICENHIADAFYKTVYYYIYYCYYYIIYCLLLYILYCLIRYATT